MNEQENLMQDEVVQYISNRHHKTPQEIITWFLPKEKNLQGSCLETNEIEIIRELIRRNRFNNIKTM